MQEVRLLRSLAFDNAARNISARIAIMAITTSNSINVKPPRAGVCRSAEVISSLVCYSTFLIRNSGCHGNGNWMRKKRCETSGVTGIGKLKLPLPSNWLVDTRSQLETLEAMLVVASKM